MMMTWNRKRTLIAGLALIVVVNVVALVGVAYNRNGTESTLRLTQRELSAPYQWHWKRENSGIALTLRWRVLDEEAAEPGYGWRYGNGGIPAWLDSAKMKSLGFPTLKFNVSYNDNSYVDKQLPKEVLLVLEMDGAAYKSSLERAGRYAEKGKDPKEAQRIVEDERSKNSRLFVIDAGLDVAALRTRYPDRTQFAIVRGQIRPQWRSNTLPSGKTSGYISEINISEINVPFAFADVFNFAQQKGKINEPEKVPPYEVSVIFGNRLEPWINAAFRSPLR